MFVPRKVKGEFLPEKTTKHGPEYRHSDVAEECLRQQETGTYMHKRAAIIETDYDKAEEALNAGREAYGTALDKFIDDEEKLEEVVKHAVSKIKNTTGKLGQSFLRLEKQANFNKLEQYVALLERANTAMSSLAKLEAAGTLKKISDALK